MTGRRRVAPCRNLIYPRAGPILPDVEPPGDSDFLPLVPDAISDRRLAALFAHWDGARRREGRAIPTRRLLTAESLAPWWPALTLFEFDGEPAASSLRFRVHGGDMVDLDRANHTGKLLEEAYPAEVHDRIRPGYAYVATRRRAIYQSREGSDLRGYPVLYEKLLLPLAGRDGAFRHILNCLYLTGPPPEMRRDDYFDAVRDERARYVARGSFD